MSAGHTEGPWTCFHCGETFTTQGAARDHFGFDPASDPACRIKLGAERGLVMALRKSEADCEELRRLLHDETCEAYRLYAAQTTRHRDQIMSAEEAGYEKGLSDGRAIEAAEADLLGRCLEALRTIVTYAPDIGVDQFLDGLSDARRILSQAREVTR